MTPEQLVGVILTVLVSSGLQALFTVQAFKVHVQYLKESTARAHERIDELQLELRNH